MYALIPASAIAAALARAHAQDSKGGGEPPPPPPTQGSSSNPGISLVFNMGADLGDKVDGQRTADFREIEFGFASDVDPHLKAQAFISVAKENGETVVDVEEAFGQYSNFGHGLSAKFGKIKGAIGRTNRNHEDQLEYLHFPFAIQDILGDEGLRAVGGSISYLFPTKQFHELTFEMVDADDGPLFKSSDADTMVSIAHYRTFFDFGQDLSAQLGATYANGPNMQNRASLYGFDYVMKWHPGRVGRSAMLESEAYWSDPGSPGSDKKFGAFAALTYEFMPRWFATFKADYGEIPETTNVHRQFSGVLTYKLTEFEHWRIQWDHVTSNFDSAKNYLSLQFQFLIGKHPAHKY